MTSQAQKDGKGLKIGHKDAVAFVVREAGRHPILFRSSFSSAAFLFGDDVILLSWDGTVATIERMLHRNQAYPLNDIWMSCLGLYHKGTLLPYRTQDPSVLISSSEGRRTLSLFRRLTEKVCDLLRKLGAGGSTVEAEMWTLDSFLDEAEFALANDDIAAATARCEAILSTVHKILLKRAPQGQASSARVSMLEVPDVPAERRDVISILFVEDYLAERILVADYLREAGYECIEAGSSEIAMRILVERDFDVIITDLMMPGRMMDGSVVALVAKNGGSRAKIILATAFGFGGSARRVPADKLLTKPFLCSELVQAVEEVLQKGPKKSMESDK
ncbi:MAG TPA: response regulator [Phycisphaerae bacterium]|nr:response regulator [Phycisphaerae bacterium]